MIDMEKKQVRAWLAHSSGMSYDGKDGLRAVVNILTAYAEYASEHEAMAVSEACEDAAQLVLDEAQNQELIGVASAGNWHRVGRLVAKIRQRGMPKQKRKLGKAVRKKKAS